ncbi:hypothetical protein DPMN_118481 [Dreissena polymorpha]|uniref:Uncharacterized protein n=1 Tax=Dreissena polymorpha TaxID=45954 RepID=A0A9D4GK67_DREPO|nr:hypothetical protein DPMN_118481 [Dreissena polymorpha]
MRNCPSSWRCRHCAREHHTSLCEHTHAKTPSTGNGTAVTRIHPNESIGIACNNDTGATVLHTTAKSPSLACCRKLR